MKNLLIFDLDSTLAPSKSFLDADMADLLIKLLEHKKVGVISGGNFSQFEKQLLKSLPIENNHLKNLFLQPTSGTRLYIWNERWCEEYAEILSVDERQHILKVVDTIFNASNIVQKNPINGPLMQDRETQITISALGQHAPLPEKISWDPDQKKRLELVAQLKAELPQYEITIGGTTSIDITRKGINKAYGIQKLIDFLHIPKDEVLFVGDALYPGGNDFPATTLGIDCEKVESPEDTKIIIKRILNES